MKTFFLQTRIYSGEGSLKVLQRFHQRKIWIVCDGFLATSPLLDRLKQVLAEDNQISLFSDITPDPNINTVVKGIEQMHALRPDVVIGFGAQQDPAASLAAEVIKLREQRGAAHPLAVIATVTGTEQDPQQRSRQIASLDEAGIAVAQSLPEAVALAHQLVSPTCPVTERPLPELLSGVAVINAGLRSFADDLQTSEIAVVHYQWAPVAGGNQRLANLLKKLK